ncbi:MAG TPA: SUMF1/EgtB/PvdO family nonheme iron enzyme [Bacteroidota bacterium]|nr:SUMF1/EgtB/PvdO family nonheme iron enzyme [Bacteroidota bacterium]
MKNEHSAHDADASFERGKKKFERGNYRSSIDELSAAIKLDPERAEAYRLRGEAKWELKNYPGAVADYNKAMRLNPEYSRMFYDIGIAKIAQRDYKHAVIELTKAIFLTPNDAEPYIARGTAKGYMKEYQGAIGDYTRAIDLRPDDADTYCMRGNIRTILQNYPGAIADYTKALELRPGHADAVRDRDLALKLMNENPEDQIPSFGGSGKTVFEKREVQFKGLLAIVVTPPDAQVFVDGTDYTGHQTIELRRGRRSILIRKEGYADLKEKVLIPQGGILLRRYKLEPKTGRLEVKIEPPDSSVQLMQQGAVVLSWTGPGVQNGIQAGDYELVCRAPGYRIDQRPITIEADVTVIEDVVLEQITFSTGEFVVVEGGRFEMGGSGQSDEKPVHLVVIAGFDIGKYPVTQKLWKDVTGEDVPGFKGDLYPVENVSWNDAQEFIQQLNELADGFTYRLPTEAEWEYAARGGSSGRGWIYSGSNSPHEVSWNLENSRMSSHPVGLKKPNDLGICDMSGNVWEWCQDWYSNEYYSQSPRSNPWGPGWGTDRVLRGGSWLDSVDNCRVSVRSLNHPGRRNAGNGFRLVRIRTDAR